MTQTIFCNSNLLTQVSSLVFDDVGNLYATNFGAPTSNILKIDTLGNASTLVTADSGNYAGMVYVNEYLYVTGYNNEVYKVDITTGTLTVFCTLPQNGAARGITYFSGAFYVVSTDNTGGSRVGTVFQIQPNGAYSVFISHSNLGVADCITVDTSGNFYITETEANQVLKFNSSGTLIQTLIVGSFGAILCYNNNLYLCDWQNNKISQYDINGNLITPNYAVGGSTYVGGGLAFDANGVFYVSNELPNGPGAGNVTILMGTYTPTPCFKEDAKILTDKGYIPIQDLKKGDLVKTLKHDYKPIHMIGFSKMYNPASTERITQQLYRCSPPAYPEVFEDLMLTGCHSILVEVFISPEQRSKTLEVLGDIYVTDRRYRLPVCLDERASVYETVGTFTVYHLALENDDMHMNYGIYANGLLVETCSKRYLKELSQMTLIE